MSLKRIATFIGLVAGTLTLLLQFYLTLLLRFEKGDSLLGALWFFFAFFTILTNLMLVLIYLSDLDKTRWLAWWRAPATRGMMAGTMVVVSVFYHVMLASLWQPTGLQLIADVTLHYAAPWFFVVWWLLFQPHRQLNWRDIPAMLAFPLVYLVWAMVRGAIVGEYPYPILEANTLGYPAVAVNCVVMLLLFVAAFAVVIAADRRLGGAVPRTA